MNNPVRPPAILIVEDESIVAMDLQELLGGLGYDAYAVAASSDEAIACAAKRCPDLVLMDIRIKGQRDGIETADIFKRRFAVPVVYLTAYADERTLERSKRTEPEGYLLKPVRPVELHSVVEIALYKHAVERQLRERERWFATTLRSIADAVISVDLGGRVKSMNPAAEALTGATALDAIGKHISAVLRFMDAPDELPVTTVLRNGRALEAREASLVNVRTGAQHLIADSVSPVVDRAETLGAVMVLRDVTQERKLQQQNELYERMASLGTMAAGVAHEVNNPLAVVTANAELLSSQLRSLAERNTAEQNTLARMSDGLADLRSAAERIQQIIGDLSVFSRPQEHHSADANIAACVRWALRTTHHELRPRARVVVAQLDGLPHVRGDEARLGQVFINLLVNAAHAIAPGRVEQNTVSITGRTDARGWVIIEVRDTGEGIPRERLGHIFEPFFTTKPAGVGTGLGLSICHGIVHSLGGEIEAESVVGRGTLIRLALPCADPRSIQMTRASAPKASESCSSPQARVLVVDDECMVLRTLVRMLDRHTLSAVCSAGEALELIEKQSFDVIISDLMMPTMTGMELYECLLRSRPELAKRMVFMSGGATTPQTEAFLNAVPNRHIMKPFTCALLEQTIVEVLAQQRSESAS